MPDDNFLECIEAIAVGMSRDRPGEWYGECLLGYPVQFCDSSVRAVSIVYRIKKTKFLTKFLTLNLPDQLIQEGAHSVHIKGQTLLTWQKLRIKGRMK